jgi:hypothetical protein
MDVKKRRRQAAWACFESYLSEEELIHAIDILERDFQVDGAINVIAYVAKICMELGINLQDHKSLCSRFDELMSETAAPMINDPLSLVHRKKRIELANKPLQSQSILVDEIPLAEREKTSITPAYNLVFISFITSVLEYTPDQKELFIILADLVTDKKLKSQDLAEFIEQWTNNPNSFIWSEELSQQTLTRLVHLIYMGLCEVLGPVAADDCFHKALAVCERKPEARLFSPSQFL